MNITLARLFYLLLLTLFMLLTACSTSISRPTITQLSPNPALFMVAHPLSYQAYDGELEITVPVGFITDLASIPRQLWWWQSPFEATMAPAILHDYLYWQQTCTKDEADAVMYLAMEEVGINANTRNLVYAGIRTPRAQNAWDQNQRARLNGESRFFTSDYAFKILSSNITSGVTLLDIQREALANEGMHSPDLNSPNLKLACRAALVELDNREIS